MVAADEVYLMSMAALANDGSICLRVSLYFNNVMSPTVVFILETKTPLQRCSLSEFSSVFALLDAGGCGGCSSKSSSCGRRWSRRVAKSDSARRALCATRFLRPHPVR